MQVDRRTHLPDGTKTKTRYIVEPFVDLMSASGIGTQALFGQRFELISSDRGVAHGALYSVLTNLDRIDYIGTVPASAVSSDPHTPTYQVSAVAAAVFKQADIKSKLLGGLPRNAAVTGKVEGSFLKLRQRGFIHMRHLRKIGENSARTYMDVAGDMVGLPYIWGGAGGVGVDCSGLVQSALALTGIDAPRDTDQQEVALGRGVDFSERQAGDLLFWPGHVGIVVDGDQLLHANAHHMCVVIEAVPDAVTRIGEVRTVKRM